MTHYVLWVAGIFAFRILMTYVASKYKGNKWPRYYPWSSVSNNKKWLDDSRGKRD